MTREFRNNFASFGGNVWLNAAGQGPLPLKAARALEEALEWKTKPYLLDHSKFVAVPRELKESIGRLIGVPPQDVILADSASYGLHILADGISWDRGDEILLMRNDFPTDILPWLALEQRGVVARQVKPREKVLQPDEVLENVTAKTRLFCVSHVHTFTGIVLDVKRFAEICKDKGVIFVLNLSQSAGTMPIDISEIFVDAVVSAGYKWLCGPYGTGFCWINPRLRARLQLNRNYWSAALSREELNSEGALAYRDIKTARKYDVFGTAGFFNFVPFKAAVDYWLEAGLDNVKACHDTLIDHFIAGLNAGPYDLISPREGRWRSSLVVVSHKNREKNERIFHSLKDQGIHTALWKGNIRLAPHVYNTVEEMDRTLQALRAM
jgi:selenocysteine lyase/cysteine desulfurase